MARKKSDKRAHSALQKADAVEPEPIMSADVVAVLNDADGAFFKAATAPLDPLAPVRVRNNGARSWSGSDFKAVGPGMVPAGGVGVVTRKKAEQLLAGQHAGVGLGVGPFEIVED